MSEVEALLAERSHYARTGKSDRVAQVDAELARHGIAVEKTAPERADRVAPETAARPKPRRRSN
jgi:hypothetical protein